MKQVWRSGIVSAAFAAAMLPGIRPAQAAPSIGIYSGQPAASSGLVLKGWGSGTAAESRDKGYGGQPVAIKIKTEGYYSGGRLQFTKPIDLTEAFTAPDSRYGFLEFVVQFANEAGAGGTVPDPTTGEIPVPQASRFLRASMVFQDGTLEAVGQPIVLFQASEPGWFSMAVPLISFKGPDREKMKTFNLRELRIFGDRKDEFYLGEVKTTTDDEPIQIEPLDNVDCSANDTVQFTAKATAGISTLKYSWDFDASDGTNNEDAVGPNVTHIYKKPSGTNQQTGDLIPYVVTLTVSDVSGAKKTEVRKLTVVVN